LQTCASNRAR